MNFDGDLAYEFEKRNRMKTEQPMRMLEADAHSRLCPMAFSHPATTCSGSHCMAWRWVGKPEPDKPSEGFCGMSTHFPSR